MPFSIYSFKRIQLFSKVSSQFRYRDMIKSRYSCIFQEYMVLAKVKLE